VEQNAVLGKRKSLETLVASRLFFGARYRTRTDKKVFWLVSFCANQYHNMGK